LEPEKKIKCNRCDKEGQAEHPCPYAIEMAEDFDTLCTCCEECETECALEV